ncbi:tRNA epoxyqueuosine(34) reductase QueG [Lysinibacillus fusiformis]|jgi:epoxyqueuosine reductase|uniref:tRNA epoxyqueuosine(34) reductase QueG n=1 Tax=Lysinibacillus TaxID=400634 RepID=UPI0004D49A3B|nr:MULTISPECIES: tRNA epoxyqueuosine(34) reductase QueG [Lysinibacillus]AJK86437.1 iron-sulfur cluster-binding protein [Lysinibacillus fusiformis]KHK50160.1 iron-sulfur cluster-binding protein [Lysinibacillus sp. A1]MCK1989243.1 tRNA epoxyqueuosine(34) reductase QueG [Lysinibacillus fusiformis]QDZ97774.1 tRNA epoxyqueuosine(34) reductase QueG [Lysinibacillus fusiformis]UXJ68307.1 tRNA epoxyqueuosine(34) reductase QueG [Lysinibacillus fusiformis]
MNIHDLQRDFVAYAISIGVDKIGFTTAAPFTELKNRLRRQQELGYQSGFEESDIEKRTEPLQLLNEAESIVSIAVAYPSRMQNAPIGKKGARRGIFCRASWGVDYHTAIRERLKLLSAWLEERVEGVRIESMVDTGALVDRAVAERAGIGWSGKNCSIITPEFGSYVYLGELITNIPFSPDKPMEDECGECRLCLDVCPTGALIQGGQLDAQRCIAFLTQTKGTLPDEFRSHIGNRLYGCDTCQTVCPKNKGKINWIHEEFMPDPELAKPLLTPLLTISNREFKAKFGHVSGSWRGKKPIQRNAILALAHFKEEAAIPDLINLLKNDDRPVIRGTSAWALGKIGGEQAKSALYDAEANEQDEEVLHEIHKGLQFFQDE